MLSRRKDATASAATLVEGTIEEAIEAELEPVLVGVQASPTTSAEAFFPAASAEAFFPAASSEAAFPATFGSTAFAPDAGSAAQPSASPSAGSSPPVDGRRGRWTRLGRRGNEAEPAPAPTQKPKYPSGQPATPGGHLLGALLVAQTIISNDQLNRALDEQALSGLRVGEQLMSMGALDELQLTRVLAEQFGIGVGDLSHRAPDPQVAGRLAEDVARRFMALPLQDVDGVVEVAVGDPQPGMEAAIQQAIGSPVQLCAVAPSEARPALDRAYRALADVERMVKAFQAAEGPNDIMATASKVCHANFVAARPAVGILQAERASPPAPMAEV